MNAHEVYSRPRRPGFTQLSITISAALALAMGFAVSTAQSPPEGAAQSEQEEERKFEDTLPAHVPLKVKLRNEQAFRNPKNRDWAKELELEVRNTGTKPIYYLNLHIMLDDFRLEDGNPVGFTIVYGRKELVYLDEPVLPEDVPVAPGETITLKLRDYQVRGYVKLREERQKADAKKLKSSLTFLNFGDGTGLEMPVGLPTRKPYPRASQSLPASRRADKTCQPPPAPSSGRLAGATPQSLLPPGTREPLAGRIFCGGERPGRARARLQLPERPRLRLRSYAVCDPLPL